MALKAQASSLLLRWVSQYKREHDGKLPAKSELPEGLGTDPSQPHHLLTGHPFLHSNLSMHVGASAVSVYADWLTQARQGSCQQQPAADAQAVNIARPAAQRDSGHAESNSFVTGSCLSISHVSGTPDRAAAARDQNECSSKPGAHRLYIY